MSRLSKSESYQGDGPGESHVEIDVFDTRDEGCKQYERLLKESMHNPNAKWKYLSIEVESFCHIRERTDCVSHEKGYYTCIGKYKCIDPSTYTSGDYASIGKEDTEEARRKRFQRSLLGAGFGIVPSTAGDSYTWRDKVEVV